MHSLPMHFIRGELGPQPISCEKNQAMSLPVESLLYRAVRFWPKANAIPLSWSDWSTKGRDSHGGLTAGTLKNRAWPLLHRLNDDFQNPLH